MLFAFRNLIDAKQFKVAFHGSKLIITKTIIIVLI